MITLTVLFIDFIYLHKHVSIPLLGFKYYAKIKPVNEYGRPLVVNFKPSLFGDFIISSEQNFDIPSSTNPKNIFTYVVESRRQLSDEELNGLIGVSAVDPTLNNDVSVNDKKVYFIHGFAGDASSLVPSNCVLKGKGIT